MESSGVGVDSWRWSDAELISALADIEAQQRLLAHREVVLLQEISARGPAMLGGYRSVGALLSGLTGRSRTATNKSVRRASAVTELPQASAALAAGSIGVEHFDTIAAFRHSLSDNANSEIWPEAERILVDYAHSATPTAVRRVANAELLLRLDPDGALPAEADLAEPHNTFSLRFTNNGYADFSGRLETETAALLLAQLEPAAKPDDMTTNSAERLGAAFRDLIHLLNPGHLHTEGGEPPHVLVRIDWDSLVTGDGAGTIGSDQLPIHASEARRLACDARIIPVVLGSTGEPIDIGRASRTVPTAIRRLVAERDRGCAFPGCAKPTRWCQVHHIVEWQHGGATKADNLVMLCREHHRLIHHSAWRVRMRQHRPEFLPPPWLDRARPNAGNPMPKAG